MAPGIQTIRESFEQDDDFKIKLFRSHGDKYAEVFYNWFDGWHNPSALGWDMRHSLAKISCPTLVVQGELDEHATRQHAFDIKDAIPDSRIWIAPNAGHMIPQEIPETFNTKLLEYLSVICPITK
jgi:pimeloyl-ACP methyl ester carboxylesterase